MKHLIAIALSGVAAVSAPAEAVTLVETFSEPFVAWESNWFGTRSNAQNYYVSEYGEPRGNRGGNLEGLWVTDGDSFRDGGDYADIEIRFDADFASSLTEFSFDVGSLLGSATLEFLDADGEVLTSFALPTSPASPTFSPTTYTRFAVASRNGIGGFNINGFAQGNVSIDNLVAQAVPEPATWAMMLVGFGAIGGALRRRNAVRTTVSFA